MSAGDPVRIEGDPIVYETVTLKANTGCTPGQVLCYDTGYAPATIALRCAQPTYGFRVAVQTVVAPADGSQKTAQTQVRGCVIVNKVAGVVGPTIGYGQKVWISTTAGKVGSMCPFSTAYKTDWALEVGEALAAATAAATTVKIRLTGH